MLKMPSRFVAASIALMCAGSVACSDAEPSAVNVCAGVSNYDFDFSIRDQFGQAQALGAKVTLTDGSYTETDSTADTLHVVGGSSSGSRVYDIRVSKPHYNDVVIPRVQARGNPCVTGNANSPVTTSIPVTLTLAPGAPALRSIRVLPVGAATLDRPPYQSSITPGLTFDANPDVPRAVTWSISGDTASIPFDPASGRVTYVCRPKTDSVTVTARSVVDTSVFDRLIVRFRGHPANGSDPAC